MTPDDLRLRYPEFEDTTEYPDERMDLFIEDAVQDIGDDFSHWGSEHRYLRALAALSAHYLTVGYTSEYGDNSPMQSIQSKKVGEVSITHSIGKTAPKSTYEDMLKATLYGQEFLALRRRSFVGIMVVVPQ